MSRRRPVVWISKLRSGSAPLLYTGAVHLAAIPVLLLLLTVDSREALGINIWIKPLKFFVSVLIYVWTLAWLMANLKLPRRQLAAIGWIVSIAMIGENFCIAMQSARGVQSHFNDNSVFDGRVFEVMGLLIVANSIAVAWLLVLSLRAQPQLGNAYTAGIRLGLLLFLVGSAAAGLMIARGAHTVGAADGGAGLPFVNWSTLAGDLRIAHFIGLHGLQIFPFAGWWLDRRRVTGGAMAVSLLAATYLVVVALIALQALAGKPLWF